VQPLLTMLVATLIFGRLAKLPSQGHPYSVFCFAALVPWIYFSRLFVSVGIGILLAFGGLLFSNHMEGSIADRV
jgi:lipopolysaccharide transport system permease protein